MEKRQQFDQMLKLRWNIGSTVITIEGMDENIVTWTERTIFNRNEYSNLFWPAEEEPTDEAIRDWFSSPESQNLNGITGINWYLRMIDDDRLVTELVLNYGLIPEEELNRIWETDNFQREITLTYAINDLEEAGGICQTD